MKLLHSTINIWSLSFFTFLISSCGGEGSDGENPGDPSLLTGYFLDSPVEGLEYVRYTKSGNTYTSNTFPLPLTDKNGKFLYKEGEYLLFKIGNIDFGFIPGKQIISPLDMEDGLGSGRQINIASFIQSLDDDADLSNGITIVEAVRQKAYTYSSYLPSFNYDYPSQVNPLVQELTALTGAGTRDLIDTGSAQSHLIQTLNSAMPGNFPFLYGYYEGTYSMEVTGCLNPEDNDVYNFSVDLQIIHQNEGNFSGQATGTTTIGTEVFEESISFNGTVSTSGELSGNTTHSFIDSEGSGSFTGSLQGETLTISNTGSDTSGDTCSYTRNISVNR